MDQLTKPDRRRSPVYGRPSLVAAKLAMRPFNERISAWQSKVAVIQGAMRSSRGATGSMFLAARELEVEAMAQLGTLRDVIADLEPTAAANSQVQDTVRALEGIAKAMGEAQRPRP